MKYQIYLNKECSIIIDRIAKNEGLKPATQIKKIIESVIYESKKSYEQMEKTFKERTIGNGQ